MRQVDALAAQQQAERPRRARRAGVARMPASSVSSSASIRLKPADFGKDEEAESASFFL
jgi:hypothetical protein